MRKLSEITYHRSLVASMVCAFVAFFAFGFVPDFDFRLRQTGTSFYFEASIMAVFSTIVCLVTMAILLRDERSGYPTSRLQVAILFWALSCLPALMLASDVI